MVASNDSGPLLVTFGDTRGHREHKTRRNGYQTHPRKPNYIAPNINWKISK